MSEERENPLTLKVPLIPEEGVERRWTLYPASFAEDRHPLPVEGDVALDGRLYRSGQTVYFTGRVSGVMRLSCSRCLEDFDRPVESEVTSVFMPRESVEEKEREVELAGEDMDVQFYEGDEISLYEPARDALALSVPMSPLCDENCKGLCPECGANLNETKCECEPRLGDPRLAALKKLKFTQGE